MIMTAIIDGDDFRLLRSKLKARGRAGKIRPFLYGGIVLILRRRATSSRARSFKSYDCTARPFLSALAAIQVREVLTASLLSQSTICKRAARRASKKPEASAKISVHLEASRCHVV